MTNSYAEGYRAGLRKALEFCKGWQHAWLVSDLEKNALYGLEASIEHELAQDAPEERRNNTSWRQTITD
jgi:hypothetical protein